MNTPASSRPLFSKFEWVFFIIIFAFLFMIGPGRIMPGSEGYERSRTNRVRNGMKVFVAALESYYAEHSAYPPTRPHPSAAGLTAIAPGHLTLNELGNKDRQAKPRKAPFIYHPSGDGWSLSAAGPDRDYDYNPTQLYELGMTLSDPLLLPHQYDSTNGTISGGALILLREMPMVGASR